ncbi:3-keto-disaccharide hydrolase [Maribellus mangrovi]|uniref:3-keto-disaccharide hydrolase n=1 Tax=Maribellus mangrovi TaxID=3133146 RepID=UPI0030EF12BB
MKSKKLMLLIMLCVVVVTSLQAQPTWKNLFEDDLSNAAYKEGVWRTENGVLTASEDECIWTVDDYDNFVLELEFKTAEGTNSGVIVYCTDTENWIPNSVEIQIADDYAEQWATADKTWQCGAIFGHLAASESRVKKPGKWNKMLVRCQDQNITVELNGKTVTEMDMALWTSGTKNPDGTDIPSWLSTPFAELATKGKIGFQGKHAGAPIWFKNIRIKAL